jgi:AraC-like DNA-binding protein
MVRKTSPVLGRGALRQQPDQQRICRIDGLLARRVAANHRCSERYIHKVFSQGETPSHYIRRLRLEHCLKDLSNRELAYLSITDIAFSRGFQHQGHFSRVFRQQFNRAPSSLRPVLSTHGSNYPTWPR